MNAQERQQTRQAWNDIAVGYDEYVTPTHQSVANTALDTAGLRSGMNFLDVAAGTGSLSLPAARRGAQVVATDIAPAMVGRLEARANTAGFNNLEALVMDGHQLEFEDDTFDIAGSQFGVMLFPDLPRALDEMVRVTKPGGTVFLVVYGNPEEVEFLGFFVQAMKAVVPDFEGLPLDPTPLPFQVADPQTLAARLSEAGVGEIAVETITEELEFHSGAQLWDWLLHSNPIAGTLVADTTEKQRRAARDVLDDMLDERAGESETAILTNPVHIGVGVT